MKKTDSKALELVRRIKNDPAFYIEKYLKIRTKAGELKQLKLNSTQRKIYEKIQELQRQKKPVRIIILKARQMGVSTITEALIFHRTATSKLTNSLIIAHEADASTNLFNMSKLFYDELPAPLRPMRKASNAKEIVFENPTADPTEKEKNPGLRSKIKIATAENREAGRSDTIHCLHASEVAFWPDAETVMVGLMQAVPNTPNSFVIIESTANGVGGYFYDMWKQAENGENDFIPLFFPWFEHEEYRMPVPSDFSLTDEEKKLKEKYHLDDEQISWRRWIIRNNFKGDEEKFRQEYPSNPEEAFLVSGRPKFHAQTLLEYRERCIDGEKGYLELPPVPNGLMKSKMIRFVSDKKGFLEVWKPPDDGKEYFIGVDTAKGLATGDFSVAVVYDENYDMVALWHGHMDTDLFADEVLKLATWYNEALIVPEENNHGLAVINRLKENYSNIYRRKTVNKITDETTEQLGWYTSEKTKALAIDNLAKHIRNKTIGTKSRKFIDECLTYIIEDDGKTNAQQGCHDDIVMASAIVLYVMESYATRVGKIVSPGEPTLPQGKTWIKDKHISEIEDELKMEAKENAWFFSQW